MLTSTSHAVLSDKFKCTFEIKDLISKVSSKVDKEFFVARLPLSASPSPDIRLTAGQVSERFTLNTPQAEFGANLNFYYKHAIKNDANGKITDARQLTCVGLVGDYCEKSSGLHLCGSGTVSCKEPQDPFDQINGWTQTTFLGLIPMFNQQTLAPRTTNIHDDNGNNVGVVNLTCQYMGSYL